MIYLTLILFMYVILCKQALEDLRQGTSDPIWKYVRGNTNRVTFKSQLQEMSDFKRQDFFLNNPFISFTEIHKNIPKQITVVHTHVNGKL